MIRQMDKEKFAIAYEFLNTGVSEESIAAFNEISVKRLLKIIERAELLGFKAFAEG